jgi:hypothetical protein
MEINKAIALLKPTQEEVDAIAVRLDLYGFGNYITKYYEWCAFLCVLEQASETSFLKELSRYTQNSAITDSVKKDIVFCINRCRDFILKHDCTTDNKKVLGVDYLSWGGSIVSTASKSFLVTYTIPSMEDSQRETEGNYRNVNNELTSAQYIAKRLRAKTNSMKLQTVELSNKLQGIAEETRKKNGKLNYRAIGRKLGLYHETVKRYCEKYRIK